MIKILDSIFANKSPIWVASFGMALVILVALVDYFTGYELAFSIFYGAPIAITAWYATRQTGIIFSVFSAITWATIDYTSGHEYSREWILFWNTGVRLGFFIVIAILLAELKAHLENEKKLARTDSLTGIMNGHAFREASISILEVAIRHKQPYAIGYVDLDNFKQVNDGWGHAEGDRVLKTVGEVLSKNIRASDFAGRLGGDEFAVLLPLTDLTGAKQVFNKIQDQLREAVQRGGWPVGFSTGIAVFAKHQLSASESFKLADELMYQVKKSGKNNFLFQEY